MSEKDFLLAHWPEVREGLCQTVNCFEDEDMDIAPIPGGWTIRQIMLHIGDTANYWLHSGVLWTEKAQTSQANIFNEKINLAQIKEFLADEHDRTMRLLAGFDPQKWDQVGAAYPDGFQPRPGWVFWHVFEHEIHHRGELSYILGLIGREGLDV